MPCSRARSEAGGYIGDSGVAYASVCVAPPAGVSVPCGIVGTGSSSTESVDDVSTGVGGAGIETGVCGVAGMTCTGVGRTWRGVAGGGGSGSKRGGGSVSIRRMATVSATGCAIGTIAGEATSRRISACTLKLPLHAPTRSQFHEGALPVIAVICRLRFALTDAVTPEWGRRVQSLRDGRKPQTRRGRGRTLSPRMGGLVPTRRGRACRNEAN